VNSRSGIPSGLASSMHLRIQDKLHFVPAGSYTNKVTAYFSVDNMLASAVMLLTVTYTIKPENMLVVIILSTVSGRNFGFFIVQ